MFKCVCIVYLWMVLMVRSFRTSTHSLFHWFTFSALILLSLLAIYCVECKSHYELEPYSKRHLLEPPIQKEAELLPTDLILVFTLDGSIRGIDRYDGTSYWTLQGGQRSSLIKADSQFKTHEMKLYDDSDDDDDDDYNEEEGYSGLFNDLVPEVHEPEVQENDILKIKNKKSKVDDSIKEDDKDLQQDVYYIIEPQDGGNLYIYGDGRPLKVKQ